MSISQTIKSIQDIMRKDDGVAGDAQRIAQLAWMFFLKRFSDLEEEMEFTEEDYRSPIPEKYRWKAWAQVENSKDAKTGDELIEFVNNGLFATLKDLNPEESTAPKMRVLIIKSVFEDAYNFMKSGTLLRQIIDKINADIDFNDSKKKHLFGDIYEQILKGLQSAGNAGEYYTPRAVTQFMVAQVNPQLGERVLDPACGTGGFLTASIDHLRKQCNSPDDLKTLQDSIYGVEKKQLPHILCMTNMMVHDITEPKNIRRGNTLAKPYTSYTESDQVNCVVANPPFGGMEEDGIENNFPKSFRTKETADLFFALIIRLLKEKGRGAIVLPDGFLFGEGVKTEIKKELLTKCNLHTIVRLPKGVFAPYTSIKTNLLFFDKGSATKEIWYYEHPYPEGYKSYSKTKPIRIEEFKAEQAWWNDRKESEFAWKVPIKQIKESNYNLDIKNPNKPEEVLQDPDVLLARFHKEDAEVNGLLTELKGVLAKCLEA